jgi:hypothetical protein
LEWKDHRVYSGLTQTSQETTASRRAYSALGLMALLLPIALGGVIPEGVTLLDTRGTRGPSILFPTSGISPGYITALEFSSSLTGKELRGLIIAFRFAESEGCI